MEFKNRKAYFEYHILDSFEAGIKLNGPDVKQLRDGKIDMSASYSMIVGGEIFVYNVGFNTSIEKKLLIHKKEILKLNIMIREKNLSLIPLQIYEKNNKFKIEIGIAKPKKNYDKRETIKKREIDKDIKKFIK